MFHCDWSNREIINQKTAALTSSSGKVHINTLLFL